MSFAKWAMIPGREYEETKSEIPAADLDFVTRYMLWREANDEWPEDHQSPGMFAVYKDPTTMFLHSRLLPRMEEATQLRLLPTYTYSRVYRPGAILEKHKDRPACEISATMLVGANYSPTWPLLVEGKQIVQEPGDMCVYRGCDVEHWREPMDGPPDAFHVQLFAHYVDADGPYSSLVNDEVRM